MVKFFLEVLPFAPILNPSNTILYALNAGRSFCSSKICLFKHFNYSKAIVKLMNVKIICFIFKKIWAYFKKIFTFRHHLTNFYCIGIKLEIIPFFITKKLYIYTATMKLNACDFMFMAQTFWPYQSFDAISVKVFRLLLERNGRCNCSNDKDEQYWFKIKLLLLKYVLSHVSRMLEGERGKRYQLNFRHFSILGKSAPIIKSEVALLRNRTVFPLLAPILPWGLQIY